jgi:hypothetical protein
LISGDRLIRAGIFSRGEIHGLLVFYDTDGILFYIGECAKGFKEGKGYQYEEETGKLQYAGEFKNDFYDGKGKYYFNKTNALFHGEFKKGLRVSGTFIDKHGMKLYQEFDVNKDLSNEVELESQVPLKSQKKIKTNLDRQLIN